MSIRYIARRTDEYDGLEAHNFLSMRGATLNK